MYGPMLKAYRELYGAKEGCQIFKEKYGEISQESLQYLIDILLNLDRNLDTFDKVRLGLFKYTDT